MKFGACSDVGLVRKENEDSFYIPSEGDELKLFLIADGVGGQNHGKFASQMTIDDVVKFFIKNENKYSSKKELMSESIKLANKNVRSFSMSKPEFEGMGTTLVSALIEDNKVILSSAGDSRCYMIRNGIISQLTVDNSYVQYLLEKGAISANEAKNHPQRNLITKAIGLEDNIDVEIEQTEICSGDILLLCTDGLTTMLSDEEILHIILKKNGNIQELAENLVSRAKDNGGTDNITAILVEV